MIDFDNLKEFATKNLNGGEGIVKAKMFADKQIKIMISILDAGSSIGEHKHTTSCEVVYILSGMAECITNGTSELLIAGQCHYCPQGSSHAIINKGNEPLVLFDIVPEFE